MVVNLRNNQTNVRVDGRRLKQVARYTLKKISRKKSYQLNILLTNDKEIATMHWKYMKVRGPTDVMAFETERNMGDLVLSTETARKQAKQFNVPIKEEIERYIVHGILHLFGYKDKESKDAAKMHTKQEQLLKELKT